MHACTSVECMLVCMAYMHSVYIQNTRTHDIPIHALYCLTSCVSQNLGCYISLSGFYLGTSFGGKMVRGKCTLGRRSGAFPPGKC